MIIEKTITLDSTDIQKAIVLYLKQIGFDVTDDTEYAIDDEENKIYIKITEKW